MNGIKFTAIPEHIPYPPKYKAALLKIHSDIIAYASTHTVACRKSRLSMITAINTATLLTMNGESCPIDYSLEDPFQDLPEYSVEQLCHDLGELYVSYNDIFFDIEMIPNPNSVKANIVKTDDDVESSNSYEEVNIPKAPKYAKIPAPVIDTPKENLYLRPPAVPRFDPTTYSLNDVIGNEHFYMHRSLPLIPEKQGDVSCTTKLDNMTNKDFMKLYPNHLIRTRAPIMYEQLGDIPMDKNLGLLIPIEGYNAEQVRENIIKYPHFFQLTRIYNDKEISFYKHIEIDGELYDTLEVWDSLPISKILPKSSEFIKEYIIRKYLLDREAGIEHKFALHGALDPFLTLFAPPEFYRDYGDPVELMKKCVTARVNFFYSRNPYIARYLSIRKGYMQPNQTIDCPFKQFCRKTTCSNICPDYIEIQYLLERNNLDRDKSIYTRSLKAIQEASEWLTAASETYKVVISDDTAETASRLTYVAICNHWKGNTLHCSVYHLNFTDYLNKLQQSWNGAPSDELDYINIFIDKAKVLIISNFDYIQFKDFQAQILLNMFTNRKVNHLSTIIVSPRISSLVGSGTFFARLKEILGKDVLN